ncbi:MAG: C_GCAxxG_C_C family protein [Kiritimatiellae bacterium]|nr:C_GCAxxG_C_C family protein [Kiritimatiellia bacterium]
MTDLAGGTLEARIEYAARRKKEMNCCQAVLVAFTDMLGKSEDELLRLGSGFGPGMGTMEGTCGALVGAIMVSSLLSPDGEARNNSRTIMSRFKELCGGATICRDLKGIGTGKVLCSCEDCVRNAVLAAGEALKIK